MKKTFKIMLVIALLLGIGFAVFATVFNADSQLLLAGNLKGDKVADDD